MEQNKLIVCNFLVDEEKNEFCGKAFSRKSNYTRHLNGVHLKEKEICECGAVLTHPAMNRHKRESCVLNPNVAALTTIKRKHKKCVATTISPNDSVSIRDSQPTSSDVIEVKKFKIETDVQLLTMKNGDIMLLQNDIEIGDFTFKLECVNPNATGKKID